MIMMALAALALSNGNAQAQPLISYIVTLSSLNRGWLYSYWYRLQQDYHAHVPKPIMLGPLGVLYIPLADPARFPTTRNHFSLRLGEAERLERVGTYLWGKSVC